MPRTRDKKLADYFMSKEDEQAVMLYLKSSDAEKDFIIRQACRSANPEIENYLYLALAKKMSFEKISQTEHVPLDEKDFYGYRRKAIYNIYCWMRWYHK